MSLPRNVDETKHPIVEEMRPIHANDQVPTGLEETIRNQLAVGRRPGRDCSSIKELLATSRCQATRFEPHSIIGVRVSYVRIYSNDDVTMTIHHIVYRINVRNAKIADVESRVGDGAGILACTEELSNLVPSCVLADFVNCKCVPATVYLKSHLASFKNSDFFRRKVVKLI